MQLENPISYVRDNLIFDNKKACWAVYELKSFDYEMLSADAKNAILRRLTLLIAGITTDAKFMVIPVRQNLDNVFDELAGRLDRNDKLYNFANNYQLNTKKYLEEVQSAEVNDYKTFISVKLEKIEAVDMLRKLKDAFDFIIKAVFNDVNVLFGTDKADISTAKIEAFARHAQEVEAEQGRRMEIFPVDSATVWWLLRRNVFRGLPKDSKIYANRYTTKFEQYYEQFELGDTQYTRPYVREIDNIFTGTWKKKATTVSFEHDCGTSYQTFLAITKIPPDMAFPGCEWIYGIQNMNKQAEIYIHIQNMEFYKALEKLGRKRKEATAQEGNILKAVPQIPQDLAMTMEEIEELEAELQANRYPLCDVTATVCVAGENAEISEQSARQIRKILEDENFLVERPYFEQLNMFIHCLPCVPFVVKNHAMRLYPKAVACGIIGATRELGDDVGYYMGTTGREGKKVFLNFAIACILDMSASATFYGNLGVGK